MIEGVLECRLDVLLLVDAHGGSHEGGGVPVEVAIFDSEIGIAPIGIHAVRRLELILDMELLDGACQQVVDALAEGFLVFGKHTTDDLVEMGAGRDEKQIAVITIVAVEGDGARSYVDAPHTQAHGLEHQLVLDGERFHLGQLV